MKILKLFLIFFLFCTPVYPQSLRQYTISGYVKEAISGEPLIGVNIYLPEKKAGTSTNNYGFYSLTLPETDSLNLVVSYIGFKTGNIRLTLHKNVELNINLNPNVVLNEVVSFC